MMRKTTILTLTLSLLSSVQLWAKDYRVSDFGAVADGTTLNTRALQRAIDVIHEEGGGKLIFPAFWSFQRNSVFPAKNAKDIWG